jgi:hypothetical protein
MIHRNQGETRHPRRCNGTNGKEEEEVKLAVLWVVRLCILIDIYRRFKAAYCVYHQGDESTRLHSAPKVVVEWLTLLLRIRGEIVLL